MGTSEAGNKKLIRRIANALKIIDVKQVPSRLDTDDIKVVAGLALPSDAQLLYVNSLYNDTVIDLNGLGNISQLIVDPLSSDPLFPFPDNAAKEIKILACTATVNLSVVALAAQIGNRYNAQWFLRPRVWDIGVDQTWNGQTLEIVGTVKNGNAVVAGINKYKFAIPGISNADSAPITSWNNIIPRNTAFGIKIQNLNNAQTAAATWGPAAIDCTLDIHLLALIVDAGFFKDLP